MPGLGTGSDDRRRGFTFAEVLAALVFLAILIPAVVQGLSLANRASVTAERTEIAARLAGNRLADLQRGRAWSASDAGGDFGEDWPGYSWELIRSDWQDAGMVELTVEVAFEVQGRECRVYLSTLVDAWE